MSDDLFKPIRLGDYTLPNRIFMAPMTRGRADEQGAPTAMVADYYAQRASAGLIITEATAVNARGDGWPGAPGIYTDHHQNGWGTVAEAVHARGGRIFMQIWHMGRTVLPEHIDGRRPIAPSAIAAEGDIPNKAGVPTKFEIPQEMSLEQISREVSSFADAARRAVAAGMDGVEIHAANNFLIDSFLRDGTNRRTDAYGGSVANRCRFLLEIVDAVVAEIEAGRVGVRISPTNAVFGIKDSDPETLFSAVARNLSPRGLAYLHVLEPANDSNSPMATSIPNVAGALRSAYDGVFVLNGGLTRETGAQAIATGRTDAIAYGMMYIANPDLVERFRHDLPLADADPATFYTPGREGLTTYPPALKVLAHAKSG